MTSSSLLCQQQAPHTPVRDRVTQTVQSIWHWCPQSLRHGYVQKLSHHMEVMVPPCSLQSTETRDWSKTKTPTSIKYGKSDTDVMSKLWARKPAHTTNRQQETTLVEQGNSGSVDWQADNGESVAKRKKQATPRPDCLSPHGRKDRSIQESGRWSKSGKASVTCSTETQHWLTSDNSTNRWRAALRTPKPPTS